MIPTVSERVKLQAEEISSLLQELLLNHSSIYRLNRQSDNVVVISVRGDCAYKPLSESGCVIQARVLEMYLRQHALLSVLFRTHPRATLNSLDNTHRALLRIIEQDDTWHKTPQQALDTARKYLRQQVELMARLYDASSDEAIFVPDTNAVLYNPDIEAWEFPGVPRFTLVLLTTVISELDSHKVNHRNEAVRDKAEKLIRKIKEYRRRGQLTEGVTVVTGKIMLQATAIEVKMADSLPWLDASDKDDRILAGVIEVMRAHPHSAVVAISNDLNFQNKAEIAQIPYMESPDP